MIKNIFAENAQRYIDAGYSPIPIMPGGKAPGYVQGGISRGLGSWSLFCDEAPNEAQLKNWSSDTVQAGIGLALGFNGLVAIDLDYGDGAIRDAIESVLPDSPFRKVGSNGYTQFYYCPGMESRKLSLPIGENGKLMSVCEILAHGKQTVIPPTIHPSGKVYQWEDEDTFLTAVKPSDLPELPLNFYEEVVAALMQAGFTFDRPAHKGERSEQGSGSAVWTEMKERALANLDAWVPALNGDASRLRDGRYRMSAHWRGGDNPTTIGITNFGIMDWARDEGMTAIDLVMAANDLSDIEAFKWLDHFCWGSGQAAMEIDKQNREIERQNKLAAAAFDERADLEDREALEAINSHSGGLDLGLSDINWDEVDENHGEFGHSEIGSQDDFALDDEPVLSGVAALDAAIEKSKPPQRTETTGAVFGSAKGLMGDLVQYFMASAKRPSAEIAGASALGIMTSLFGRRWAAQHTDVSYTYPNIYIACTAASGFGKSTAANAAQKLYERMVEAGMAGYTPPPSYDEETGEEIEGSASDLQEVMYRVLSEGEVYSYGGIHGEMYDYPLRTLIIDEASDFIDALFDKSAPQARAMRGVIKKLTTHSDGKLAAEIKAAKGTSKGHVHNPHLSILMQSTRDAFYDAIPSKFYNDGFMGRFLLLDEREKAPRGRRVGDNSALIERVTREGAAVIAARLADPHDLSLGGYAMPDLPIQPIVVGQTHDAMELFEAADGWHYDANINTDGYRPDRDLWNRFLEMAKKLAILHALGRNWRNPVINGDDARFGIRLAHSSTATMAEVLVDTRESPSRAAEENAKVMERIKRFILNKSDGTAPRGKLLSYLRLSGDIADRAISTMIEGGDITIETGPRGGAVYRWTGPVNG
ncbi:bifunctional DNA primase/polymerase [Sulfitobacter sp. 1A15106]|uniref:bifunctional DNA primase/polymerase n=1 Tax=Sulfitobacter sp. 1A15106 TaxID=3368590 RepID=UPI00374699F9